MKHISNSSFTATNTGKSKVVKNVKAATPVKKMNRYQYTEKDLGEGILNMGITPSYAASLRSFASA